MSKELPEGVLINGVQEEIKVEIQFFGVATLAQAMSMVQKIEDRVMTLDCLRAQMNSKGVCPWKVNNKLDQGSKSGGPQTRSNDLD